MAKPPDIKHIFDQILKDFESDPNPQKVLVPYRGSKGTYTVREYKIAQNPRYRITDPYLIFIIFVNLKQFIFKGRDEKEAWTVPVKFKGEPFLLTYRKFGFYIIGKKRAKYITQLGREAMYKIYKSLPYAETLIQPFIKQTVQKGNVTLENYYNEILARYNFFKKKAIAEFEKSRVPRYKTKNHNKKVGPAILVTSIQDLSWKNRIAANYYAGAMLDSYFSLLEHLLVLILPLVRGIDFSNLDIEQFILKNWKEKLKFLLPLSETEVGNLFESLLIIKENLRNPLSHGHFEKDGNSILVHMKWIGAIPLNLSKREKHFTYGWTPIYHENFESIIRTFETFSQYLAEHERTRYAIVYLKSGLNVAFDENSRWRYATAMKDDATFEKFIKDEEMHYTNAMNMDW